MVYTYDDPLVPYSKGKLTKVWRLVGDPEVEVDSDRILEYDMMQNVARGRKVIGTGTVDVEHTYDSAGRVLTLKYLAGHGFATDKAYSYDYDGAGNIKYLKDNGAGTDLVEYTGYNAIGQPQYATFPKPGGTQVRTAYGYYPDQEASIHS